jgi:hypothetical protein
MMAPIVVKQWPNIGTNCGQINILGTKTTTATNIKANDFNALGSQGANSV